MLASPSAGFPERANQRRSLEVLAKATSRAATRLGISQRDLAEIIGVSAAAISRVVHNHHLPASGKAVELAALFVRLFRSLDAIVGGDEAVAMQWLRNDNVALGGVPLTLMKDVAGLVNCLAYLDSRRALV